MLAASPRDDWRFAALLSLSSRLQLLESILIQVVSEPEDQSRSCKKENRGADGKPDDCSDNVRRLCLAGGYVSCPTQNIAQGRSSNT